MSGSGSPKRRPARKISRRRVEVEIPDGDFAGWAITAWADFPAKYLADLQSGDVARILAALKAITIDHNLPDESGAIAGDLGDVDYPGLLKVAEAAMDAMQRLPPR